jgi:hypothetical protein
MLVGAGAASAQVPTSPKETTPFDVEAYELQVEQDRQELRVHQLRLRLQHAPQPVGRATTMEVRLEGHEDGTAYVSRPLDRRAIPLLVQYGHRQFIRPPTIRDGDGIYDNRMYERMKALPGSRGLPEWKLERHLGQEVELKVQTMSQGRGRVILDLSPIESAPRR